MHEKAVGCHLRPLQVFSKLKKDKELIKLRIVEKLVDAGNEFQSEIVRCVNEYLKASQ